MEKNNESQQDILNLKKESNNIPKPKKIILKGFNKVKKEEEEKEEDLPVTFGNVFRPRRTTASYCFQEYTLCKSEGGAVNGGRNVLPIHVQEIVDIYESILSHFESIKGSVCLLFFFSFKVVMII